MTGITAALVIVLHHDQRSSFHTTTATQKLQRLDALPTNIVSLNGSCCLVVDKEGGKLFAKAQLKIVA